MGKLILGILLGVLRGIGVVLLVLLVLLLILLLVRVQVRVAYEDGAPSLRVRYGPVKLQLFPKKEKDPSAPPKKKKPPRKEKAKKEKPEKEKKKFRVNLDQILYSLETLPPILGRALKRTGRSIHIHPLKLYILAAGADPADTALLYGKMEAAVAAGLPILEKALRLKDPDVRLYLDFNQQQMDFIADVGVALRPISLVWIALRAGGSLVKWFLGFRKLASPPAEKEPSQKETDENSETEHEAA